ncbi:MAG: SpoIIE family protein phosphatase [Flavobacteriales bacterium]
MTRLDRLTERLNLKEFQLRALLGVTKAINNNLAQEELLRSFAQIMCGELGITRLMLFTLASEWQCVQAVGADGADRLDIRPFVERYKDIRFIGAESGQEELSGFDIIVPVYHHDRPLAMLLIGDIDDSEQRMSPAVKHMNFIETLTNVIAVALENRRLARQALLQERDKRELELAAEMQMMLVPRDLPDDERLQASAWYLPHRQVGGDYYDLIRCGEDEVVIAIADVSGKGMAAALLMSNFQATLRAKVPSTHLPLDELVRDLNTNVLERARGERFITLFLARVDLRNGAMQFVNAGHNAPMLLTGGGVQELRSGSIALGMLPELPFVHVGEADLRGGTLLCYTDGLVEQEDNFGTAFDLAPLRKALQDFAPAGTQAVNEAVIATFEAHRAGMPYLDDIALLTCRFA